MSDRRDDEPARQQIAAGPPQTPPRRLNASYKAAQANLLGKTVAAAAPATDRHSDVKQANEITLKQIKSELDSRHAGVGVGVGVDVDVAPPERHGRKDNNNKMKESYDGKDDAELSVDDGNESEHLLAGHQQQQQQQLLPLQQQQLQQQQQQHQRKHTGNYEGVERDEGDEGYADRRQPQTARVNFNKAQNKDGGSADIVVVIDAGSNGGSGGGSGGKISYKDDKEAADDYNHHHNDAKRVKMTQYGNTGNYGNTANHTQFQLDMQTVPEDMPAGNNGSNNSGYSDLNGVTTLGSLNPTTTTATSGVSGTAGTTMKVTTRSAGGESPYNNGKEHDDDDQDSHYKGPKFWHYLVRNWLTTSERLALLAIFVVVWLLAYILLPRYAVPETPIMRMIFLFIGAQVSGILVTFLHLPDMLGMLFFGVLYTNVNLADFSQIQPLEKFLRELALINIMLLAGLGLDGNAFRQLWAMILRLTLVPTMAEVTVIAVLAHYMLSMPWLWGILLGLVVTAVSPNVVVTVMLKLKEERLGMNKGIHTLIYAMTSCNDVVAIFLFGVISGVIFSQGTLTEQILQGPIGVGIGVVFGYIYGLMLQYVPSKNSNYANGLRFILTILGGTLAVLGSKAIGYTSAGALGCMSIAFVAGIGWKRQLQQLTPQQQQANENCSVAKRLDLLWKFLKPVSFALIGKEINFGVLEGKVVGYGALLVLLGSLFRLAFAYISTYGGNLSRKERAYITISGFPKATVQAALGPIALDLARSLSASDEEVALARTVLVISVLAIIFTAPLGAILMLRLAPRCLERSENEEPFDAVMNSSSKNGQNNNYRGGRIRGGGGSANGSGAGDGDGSSNDDNDGHKSEKMLASVAAASVYPTLRSDVAAAVDAADDAVLVDVVPVDADGGGRDDDGGRTRPARHLS